MGFKKIPWLIWIFLIGVLFAGAVSLAENPEVAAPEEQWIYGCLRRNGLRTVNVDQQRFQAAAGYFIQIDRS